MAINYSIVKHATVGASKLLATNYGAHIYNVTLSSDADNGNIIKRGDWKSLNNYAEAAATTFDGVVRGKAANGNWYVEVLSDQGFDALLVYNPAVNAPEWTEEFKAESAFYNKAGDVVRAHELMKGDIFEVSVEAFTKTPNVGDEVKTISGKKLVPTAKQG